MNNANTTAQQQNMNAGVLFTEQLASHVIVDIGQITALTATGRATVTTGVVHNGAVRTYENVEILYIGNALSSLTVSPAGSMCLLICPRTVMPSIDNGVVLYNVSKYSVTGMKAIPLTHGTRAVTTMGMTDAGNITFKSGDFSIDIGQHGCTVYVNKGVMKLHVDQAGSVVQSYGKDMIQKFVGPDGSLSEVRFAADGKVMYYETYALDGTTTVRRISKEPVKLVDLPGYTEWASIHTYLPDGTITDDTINNSGLIVRDEDGNIVSQLTLAQDGTSTLFGTTSVVLDCKDADGNAQSSVSYDAEGNITIAAMKTLSIDIAEGKYTLSVNDSGELSITAANNEVVIDSSGVSVTDASGNKITTASSGITLNDASGNKVETSASGITLSDALGNKMETSAAGIKLTSVMGTSADFGAIVKIG